MDHPPRPNSGGHLPLAGEGFDSLAPDYEATKISEYCCVVLWFCCFVVSGGWLVGWLWLVGWFRGFCIGFAAHADMGNRFASRADMGNRFAEHADMGIGFAEHLQTWASGLQNMQTWASGLQNMQTLATMISGRGHGLRRHGQG